MKGQTSTRTKVLHALMIVVLTILLLLFIAPFILVVINVFKTKADINTAPLALIGKHGFTLENFPRAMDKMNFVTVFGNSAVITISATILTILFSAMCAYVIVRNPRGSSAAWCSHLWWPPWSFRSRCSWSRSCPSTAVCLTC